MQMKRITDHISQCQKQGQIPDVSGLLTNNQLLKFIHGAETIMETAHLFPHLAAEKEAARQISELCRRELSKRGVEAPRPSASTEH